MKNLDSQNTLREGLGTKNDPYRSADGTAGIQAALGNLADRGGLLSLDCGRYDIYKSVVFETPSLALDGGVWACNTDPNGVFETDFGTKIRMRGTDYPALVIGRERPCVSGAIIRNLGIQGDIVGMDTRRIVDFDNIEAAAGLCFDSVRTDQCAFTKLSFCGLATAVVATKNAEIDACIFEQINADGCANGFWFAPRASYYARIRSCIIADNPYYGIYVGGKGAQMHNLEILDSHFVRNGGCFSDAVPHKPAAVFLDGVSRCAVTHCLFDDPGTFWYYDDSAKSNEERRPSHIKIPALRIVGNENRIRDNTFRNSSADSITLEGNGNVLMNNIADGNVRINGKGNTVAGLVFTKPAAKLILEGEARDTTVILGVEEWRIVRS